jgi:glycosyltransferase involved in cell wall biosynthesis
MNGGHSLLSAYFGGENILYSKFGSPMAQELRAENNSFYRWYHEFGNQRVVHVADYAELFNRIDIQWIKREPIVNILVRTSGRPNYFKECMNSILNQTYVNINIYVSIDDKSNDYTVKYPIYPVFVEKKEDIECIDGNEDYGKVFPYNSYLNDLQAKVKEGLILILDDDDVYLDNRAVEKIVNQYKKGSELIFWRVNISEGVVIPEKSKLGSEPELYKMSMIGFAYDSKYKEKFLPYKRADYRVAKKLFERIRNIGTINEVLTATQDGAHFGQRVDKRVNIKKEEMKRNKVQIRVINDRNQHGKFDVKIGSIIEITDNVAATWVKTGIAEYLDKPKKETPKINIEGVKKVVKEVTEQKKEFAEKELKKTKSLPKKKNKK